MRQRTFGWTLILVSCLALGMGLAIALFGGRGSPRAPEPAPSNSVRITDATSGTIPCPDSAYDYTVVREAYTGAEYLIVRCPQGIAIVKLEPRPLELNGGAKP